MSLEQVQSKEADQDVWETDMFSFVRCGRLVLICQEECDDKWDSDNRLRAWKQSLMHCGKRGQWHFLKPRMACCQLCFTQGLLIFFSSISLLCDNDSNRRWQCYGTYREGDVAMQQVASEVAVWPCRGAQSSPAPRGWEPGWDMAVSWQY